MQCFWCTIVEGTPVLREHEAARWLEIENLDDVDWLPADVSILGLIKERMVEQVAAETLQKHKRAFEDLT